VHERSFGGTPAPDFDAPHPAVRDVPVPAAAAGKISRRRRRNSMVSSFLASAPKQRIYRKKSRHGGCGRRRGPRGRANMHAAAVYESDNAVEWPNADLRETRTNPQATARCVMQQQRERMPALAADCRQLK